MVDLTGYKLTFDDEFNARSISQSGSTTTWADIRSEWRYDGFSDIGFGTSSFLDAGSGYDPFAVANGALSITASPNKTPYGYPGSWASGLLQSKASFSQTYGYFEVRADLADTKGAWDAFWLLPEKGLATGRPGWQELDVVEHYGADNAGAYSAIHTTDATSPPGVYSQSAATTTGYHTYGMDWQKDTVSFYVDGVLTGREATPSDMTGPMYLLLDLATNADATSATPPITTKVDYVRVYSKDPAATAVALDKVSSPDGSDPGLHGAASLLPSVAIVAQRLAHDTGADGADGITSDGRVTLSGTVAGGAGTRVVVRDGQTALGAAVLDGAGGWSFATTLAAGSHALAAVAIDLNGQTATAAAAPLTVLTAPPVITLSSETLDAAGNARLSGTVAGAAGTTVAVYAGSDLLGAATLDGRGGWSFAKTLASGHYTLKAVATDPAGNTASVDPPLDVPPPATPVTATLISDTGSDAADGLTRIAAIKGTGAAAALVSFTIDGTLQATTATADASGAYTYVPTGLGEGAHTIVAREAGGSASLSVVLDTTAPAMTATLAHDTGSSATDRITRDPTLTGSGDAGALVTLSEGAVVLGTTTAGPKGAWSYTPTGLADGRHTIVAAETDAAGNTGTTSLAFTLDTTAPAFSAALAHDTGSSATDRVTRDLTLTGGGDAFATVTLLERGVWIGGVTADATGAWTTRPKWLLQGTHVITALETDAAGNQTSTTLTLLLDTTAPAVTIAGTSGRTDTAAQLITGTGEAGTLVTLRDNGTAIGSPVTVGQNGSWSSAITLPSHGRNAITATDTDTAGNARTTGPVTLTFDHAPIFTSGQGTVAAYAVAAGHGAIATLSATDPDPGDRISYALLGTDGRAVSAAGGFAIDVHSGALRFTAPPKAGTYALTALATDNDGAAARQSITVSVGPDPVSATAAGRATSPPTHTLFSGAVGGTVSSAETERLAAHSARIGGNTMLLTNPSTTLDAMMAGHATGAGHAVG